jgi:hypothetical protein
MSKKQNKKEEEEAPLFLDFLLFMVWYIGDPADRYEVPYSPWMRWSPVHTILVSRDVVHWAMMNATNTANPD